MRFQEDVLIGYKANDLTFIQKFAEYSHQIQRLSRNDFNVIRENKDFESNPVKAISHKVFKWE